MRTNSPTSLGNSSNLAACLPPDVIADGWA
jgi:hypothetical protein